MAQNLLQTIRLLTSLVLVLLISTTLSAQIRNAYNLGSIGMTGTISPVFSGPVVITGANCFVLTNGVKTFDLPQVGYFSTACKLLLEQESGLRLTSYPNPVINNLTVQTTSQTQLLADKEIQLQLLDIQGRVIQTYNTDSKGINQGYKIPMSNLASGGYYIKAVSGTNNIQVLSIIKSN
jgi:Secretion system C-terminal sorting domain